MLTYADVWHIPLRLQLRIPRRSRRCCRAQTHLPVRACYDSRSYSRESRGRFAPAMTATGGGGRRRREGGGGGGDEDDDEDDDDDFFDKKNEMVEKGRGRIGCVSKSTECFFEDCQCEKKYINKVDEEEEVESGRGRGGGRILKKM